MRKRIPPRGLKSYVPFHFPYTNGDIKEGLEDECGIEKWDYYIENENVNVSTAAYMSGFNGLSTYTFSQPRRLILTGAFDYENNTDVLGFVTSTNNSGIYNLNSSSNYEFEIVSYFHSSVMTGYIENGTFQIILEHKNEQKNAVTDLKLVINASEYDNEEYGGYWCEGGSTTYQSNISLQSNAWSLNTKENLNITFTYEDYIDTEYDENGLNSFNRKEALKWLIPNTIIYIVLRITENIATVYINGQEKLRSVLPSNVVINPSRLKLGGYSGDFSNYAFWHRARTGNPKVPTEIYPFTLNVNNIGGFGTGADGDFKLGKTDNFNCCGLVSEVIDARTLKVKSWIGGNSGVMASPKSEVMIHVTKPRRNEVNEWPQLGMYAFRKIAILDGTTITLNREIREETDGFSLSQELIDEYYVQIIVVPNYRTFTAPYEFHPVNWNSNECGGIVILRTTGDCNVERITTRTYGGIRAYDKHQMSHNKLLNRFLCSSGGGIIIFCGGKLTVSCCLGNDSDLPVDKSANNCGCAGHGGGTISRTRNGHSINWTKPGRDYLKNPEEISISGIHSSYYCMFGGACIIIVARKAAIKNDTYLAGGGQIGTIQTGGRGDGNIGGGCGFCYMAIGELLNG